MSEKPIINTAASVKARLLNIARARGCTVNTLLSRYANERFLYRLSKSPYRNNFILKGSNLFLIWQKGYPYRPTIDADFLVLGRSDQQYLKSVFAEICTVDTRESDGLIFSPDTIRATEIREEAQYGGTRITLTGLLGSMRLYLQFDIGVGDVVTPAPEWAEYPVLLDFAVPVLQTYPRETAIAEKAKTMVTLGIHNSRMKDFADILVLQRHFSYDFSVLRTAISRTFARYGVSMPGSLPLCFTEEFFHSKEKQKQWEAFCKKTGITDLPTDFSIAAAECALFLVPLFFPPTPTPRCWDQDTGWISEISG